MPPPQTETTAATVLGAVPPANPRAPGAEQLPQNPAVGYGERAKRHATPDDLQAIASLLVDLRAVNGLREHKPGNFYLRSRAFLHFHADPTGVFADVRFEDEDFERVPVNSPGAQLALLAQVRVAVGENTTPG